MSRTRPNGIEQALLTVPCQWCGAAAGDWCLTRSGRWSTLLHSDRFWDARRAGILTVYVGGHR